MSGTLPLLRSALKGGPSPPCGERSVDTDGPDCKTRPSLCYYRRTNRGPLAAQVELPSRCLSVWLDFAGSAVMVARLMWVPDSLLVLASSLTSVPMFSFFWPKLSDNLTWTVVSFLVAFPLQNAIRSAYTRRESAVATLAEFRALLVNVYLANASWDWPGAERFNGRREDNRPISEGGQGIKKKPCTQALSADHHERVRHLCLRIVDALQDLLLVPRSGHPRERLCCGREEKRQIDAAERQGRRQIMKMLTRLHAATEALKAAGMPANEASRINQYNLQLMRAFEMLWAFKTYRTPVSLRATMRILIQLLPFFYGPYWVRVARGDDGKLSQQGLVFASLFASFISLVLIAMVNLEENMENPFKHSASDTVRVKEEMELCRESVLEAARDLASTWFEGLDFEWEATGRSGAESEPCGSERGTP